MGWSGGWIVLVADTSARSLTRTQVKDEEGAEGGRTEEKGGKGDEDEDEDEDEEDRPKLSRKQRRRLNRLSVAELKQLVARPDVVEVGFGFFLCGCTRGGVGGFG